MAITYENLADQKFKGMTVVRARLNFYGEQDHQRWTYKTNNIKGETLYYKVWNTTYVRRNNMLKAIEAGFYDEDLTPALRSILMDETGMRGYVMAACEESKDVEAFDGNFFERIKTKTKQTGFFNYDVRPHHMMFYHGQPSLIDLEGVYPLEQLDDLERYHCHFGHLEYEAYVKTLISRLLNESDVR